ncbi:MAG: hypothetical protein FJ405_04050 [Verrucomicrobia bacterium]|nr:hypothetical protein [Verrucomicrobiota bacterium]
MVTSSDLVSKYCVEDPLGLWKWSTNRDALEWADGSTLVCTDELEHITRRLALRGLPPFPCLALALAAHRGILRETDALTAWITDKRQGDALNSRLHEEVTQAVTALHALRGLHTSGSSLSEARLWIMDALFAQPEFDSVRLNVPSNLEGEWKLETPLEAHPIHGQNRHWLKVVGRASARLTQGKIQRLLETGIEFELKAASVAVPACDRARLMLEELQSDPDLASLTLAAKGLMAAIQLPKRLSADNEPSTGGAADLSNHGPLDRLLLSELAHDDLTLSARIALNEALYLRREPPASEPIGHLAVLVDSGVRMWGLPRMFAAAACLAFAAQGSRKETFNCWRTEGHSTVECDFLSKPGLRAFFKSPSLDAHAGEALRAFQAGSLDLKCDRRILITHPDALADPSFRKSLESNASLLTHIATLDARGSFRLFEPPFTPSSICSRSQLSVEEILASRTASQDFKTRGSDPAVPAFMKLDPAPLLVPLDVAPDYSTAPSATGRRFAVCRERKLMVFPQPGKGARQMARKLPGGRTVFLDEWENWVVVVKEGSARIPNRLACYSDTMEPRVADLCAGEPALAAFRSGSVLLIARLWDVLAYSLPTGALLDRKPSTEPWHRGRFYGSGAAFAAAYWNGQSIQFEPVRIPEWIQRNGIAAVFDRDQIPGPWVITQACQVISLADGSQIRIPLPISQSSHARNIVFSRDGRRLAVSVPNLGFSQMFELPLEQGPSCTAQAISGSLESNPPAAPMGTHRMLHAIRLSSDRNLWVQTPDRAWRKLLIREELNEFAWSEPLTLSMDPEHTTPFSDPQRLPSGWKYATADLGSGRRAFMDPRGFLHLQDLTGKHPDISLVITTGLTAIWTSHSMTGGADYLLPPNSTVNHRSTALAIRNWLLTA